MFFFPFATDAPLYHWPIVTVLLIVVNTAIYFASGGYSAESGIDSHLADLLVLHFTHVNPLEWVTNNFMHADFWHLLGNMMFLWPFGLVVEGKLGWWKYLAVYLGIGAVYGAVMQLAMFLTGAQEGAALGASAALFGLLALCVVWAPKNDLKIAYFIMFGMMGRWGVYEMSIMAFGLIYVAWQGVMFAVAGFHVSSAGLHLVGFAVGFPLGLVMLKQRWVDCEGWDLLSVWAGKHRKIPDVIEQRKNAEEVSRRAEELQLNDLRKGRTAAMELMATHLAEGHANIAYAIYRKYSGPDGGWPLPDELLSSLVTGLVQQKMWPESMALLRQVIANNPSQADAARLKLAQLLIQAEQRPRQALAVLAKLPEDLPAAQSTRRSQLKTLAEQAIAEGELEVAVEDW